MTAERGTAVSRRRSSLRWARLAAMTGITTDARRADLGVRILHNGDHLARHLLGRLVVLLELVFDVTVGAIDAERRLEGEHDFGQALGGQPLERLYVFILLLGALFFAGRRRIERRQLDRPA